MPKNIIMASGSEGATQADIEKVLVDNGYEADKPEEETVELTEPKREDFETDEAFEAAQAEHEAAAAAAEEKAEEDAEEREEKEAEAAQAKQEARHKLSRRQRAIEKATKPLQDQIKKLEEQVAAVTGKKPAEVEPAKLVAPKREDFASDADFEEAQFDFRYKQRRAKEQAEETQNALKAEAKEVENEYFAKRDKIKEEYPDWDDVMAQAGETGIADFAIQTILRLEEGPRVSYYLAKHPDKLDEINRMFPTKAAVELARLHDRLRRDKKPSGDLEETVKPKPKPRVLPAPMRPVGAAVTNSSLSSREAAAKRDFKAFKRAQHAGR